MDECDVVTGLRGALVEMADDSSNGVLCGIIDELKCDVVLTGGFYETLVVSLRPEQFWGCVYQE